MFSQPQGARKRKAATMSTGVVRGPGRSAAGLDARPVLPRFDKAAAPDPTPGLLNAAPSFPVLADRIEGELAARAKDVP